MPQSVLLKAAGLHTFENNLSEVPPGALTVADNVVIDRNGIIEPRRGFQQYGNTFGISVDRAKQLMTYKNRILRHFGSTLQYDSNGSGTFLSFSGSYSETESGLRIKYTEANGNFYFTTASGIECISAIDAGQFTTAARYIRPAGGAQALDVNGILDYSGGGWFIYQTSQPGQSKVAYRVTWGFNDPNGNFIEGVPSSRLVLTNFSETDPANVILSFQIPSEITTTDTQYFYRIYRTAIVQTSTGVTLANLDPGDEEYLVIQDFPSGAELISRTVTVTDNVPDSFRKNGSLLYTNPVSGAGILQANYPPPIAKDITLFQNTVFYANTVTIQQLKLSLLSVQALISGTSSVTIGTQTYTFIGTKEIQNLTFDSQANTTDGGYFLINGPSNLRKYFVWFNKSGAPEIQNLQFDSVVNTTDGGYFLINSSNDLDQYFVWFDKTGSTVPPSGGDTLNRTGIRVSLVGLTTADDVALAVSNAIANSDFATAVSLDTVTVTNTTNGATTAAIDGIVPVGGAFNITLVQAGVNPTAQPSGADTIGRLPIPVDISLAITNADVANAVSTALNSVIDFTASVAGPIVTVTNSDNGPSVAAINSAIVPVGGVFSAVVIQSGTGEDTTLKHVLLAGSISPSQNIDETARSLVKVINANTLSTVDAFYTSGPTDLPGMFLLQTRNISDPSFSVTANSTNTGNEFSPALPTSGTSVSSTNQTEINSIYYSKFQQPEAVPIVNKFNVGPKDKAILRILPIRTGLMILKEDGIYQLTGTNGQFVINPFDSSAVILAPDSASILNNQIYMFSTQGVVTVTDTGVNVISRPIEDQLEKIITPAYNYRPNTFGVGYESDRAYLMWTVTNSNDTQPTQCFRFNTFTNTWTRWPIIKTCGVVLLSENVLYLGPGDVNFIEKERKSVDRTDYSDRVYPLQLPAASVISETELTLSSISNVEDGDVLTQTQYLTIYQFNQLLQKLDLDPGVGYKNYFSTLGANPGANLRASLDALAHKLDTDAGLSESNFYSSMTHGTNFSDYQVDFNILVGLLNANTNAKHHNYPTSTGTIFFDILIESIVPNTSDVLIKYPSPVIEGGILLSRGIKTEIVWSPQTFGDPSISKHVSEGTFMFENNDFYTAEISYASDLEPGFEPIPFNEAGIGDWGFFVWNEQNWGGGGSQVPIRTYIPRYKQYCRFIRPRFVHITAREKFSILGLSLTLRPLTERAYRG